MRACLQGMGSLKLHLQLQEGDDAGPLGALPQPPMPRPGYAYPRETLRPNRVVWAKVEGHDWWPARVVRRRAVPKEVRLRVAGAYAVAWLCPSIPS